MVRYATKSLDQKGASAAHDKAIGNGDIFDVVGLSLRRGNANPLCIVPMLTDDL